ncbi:MAG: permease [Anaerolineales bacterium]
MQTSPAIRRIPRQWFFLLALLVILATFPPELWFLLANRITDFAAIFLGIFVEAVPFLLFGTLASGLVEVFFSRDMLLRLIPKRALPGTILGSLLGIIFPVCECGTVPLTRRMFRKGLPLSAGVAFLLAAPVINPIVFFATASAFGFGLMLALRFILTFGIAVSTGMVFSTAKSPLEALKPVSTIEYIPANLQIAAPLQKPPLAERWRNVLTIALEEFFEMGRYLVIGAALAAAMQTFVPQSLLVAIGQGPIVSILAMMALAVILSICSTVDSFVALGFVGIFSPGAILAFLVFGPMVDIKAVLMYARVFELRPLIYLIVIPALLSLLAGIIVNYTLPGL